MLHAYRHGDHADPDGLVACAGRVLVDGWTAADLQEIAEEAAAHDGPPLRLDVYASHGMWWDEHIACVPASVIERLRAEWAAG